MPVELAEGVEPCPQCTYPNNDLGPGVLVSIGCPVCKGTGRKNFFKLTAEKRGGHYHARLWHGRPGSMAMLGHIIFDEVGFHEFSLKFKDEPIFTIEVV